MKVPSAAGPTDIATPTQMSVTAAKDWFLGLPDHLTDTQNQIARAILKEINERLGFLDNVGLDYLNLDRTSGTLSAAARASASASPARSVRASAACSTCSTSPASASTSATTTGCWKR